MFRIHIPAKTKYILSRLTECGFEAYVVGGCVRDALMGRTPHDWDIATSATPEQVFFCFEGKYIIPTGLKHGTVTVVHEQEPFEVTTFRIDGDYTDGRHPDNVIFTTSLKKDLARRDFTINAMAADKDGNIIDPFGGMTDIQKKQIRCVGSAEKRFSEDALRILRALRFSSVLGFSIEHDTTRAIRNNKNLLFNIARERICKEYSQLLVGVNAADVLLGFPDVVAISFPELWKCVGFEQNNSYHCYDVYRHIVESVRNIEPDLVLRLTMLLHDVGKPRCFEWGKDGNGHFCNHGHVSADIAEKRLRELRFDGTTIRDVVQLIDVHDTRFPAKENSVCRIMKKIGEKQMRRFLAVRRADIMAQAEYNREERLEKVNRIEAIFEGILRQNTAFQIKDLTVNGNDLISVGMNPGPEMGELLDKMLSLVMDGELQNEREELLDYARYALEIERVLRG